MGLRFQGWQCNCHPNKALRGGQACRLNVSVSPRHNSLLRPGGGSLAEIPPPRYIAGSAVRMRYGMFNLLPRNPKFFDYFDRDTEVLVRTAESFCRFLESSGDPREDSKKLKELEHEADRITHEAMELLHRSFITPVERGDLRRLILALDEVVDYLDDAARRIALYEVGAILPEVCAMGKVVVDLARAVQTAVHDLRNLRKKNRILETASKSSDWRTSATICTTSPWPRFSRPAWTR